VATAEYPSFLPGPVQDGYSLRRGRNVTVIGLEGGPGRARQTSLGTPHRATATFVCLEDEYTGVTGFFRERCQERTDFFRLPLLIDVPVVVPHLCRALSDVGEPEKLESTQGTIYVVSVDLEVIPNPIRSSTLLLQNVADERVTAGNTAQGYAPTMAEFPDGRSVILIGCRGTSSGVAVALDGTYVIDSHPTPQSITLLNAAAVNADWTVLNGTASQALFPDKQGGACILLPE
jgi:hypothetical protein